jgi:hypothetical protein
MSTASASDLPNLRTKSAAKAGHRLAAGHDGGEQSFRAIGHKDEVHVPRGLLQRLQESVGGRDVEAVRLQDDVDLDPGLIRPVDGMKADVGDLLHEDEVAFGEDRLHIGMQPAQHAPAGVALAAASVRAGQPRREGHSGLGLAAPWRSLKQVGVRGALLQRALQDGHRHRLTHDIGEQTND